MKKIAMMTLLSVLFSMAFAQDRYGHWYLGSELGFTGFDEYSFDNEYRRQEEGGVSFGIFGGYQVNSYLAVQLGATHVSAMDIRIRRYHDDIEITDDPASDYSTLEFLTIGRIPLGQNVALFGLAGIQHYDYDHDYMSNFDYQLEKTDGSDVVLGFGLEWFYNRNLFSRITFKATDVTADYDYHERTRSSDVHQGQVSFAIAYRF